MLLEYESYNFIITIFFRKSKKNIDLNRLNGKKSFYGKFFGYEFVAFSEYIFIHDFFLKYIYTVNCI